jgi:hypothetical protein
MGFTFQWDDERKTVLRYVAAGEWNWKDYHYIVRASLFHLHRLGHPVDVIVDLSGSTRARMPAGIQAHVRTMGRKDQANLSGRAVVIGMPAEDVQALTGDSRILKTTDGMILFVDDDEAARAVIAGWRAAEA